MKFKMASVGFMLRFVNWTEVYEKYKNGAYTQPGVLSSSVVTVRMTSMKEEKLSSNPNDDKYQIHTRDGTEINIFTTGCVLFKGVKGVTIDCACCHTSLPVERKENTPIPKSLSHSYKLVKVNGVFVKRLFIDCLYNKIACDFECAIYAAKRQYGPEVEEYVRILHRMMHPKSGHLREAADPDLLVHNGGSMSYEDYKKDVRETYVPLVGLNFTPVKQSVALI